jgi:hypothetical protein
MDRLIDINPKAAAKGAMNIYCAIRLLQDLKAAPGPKADQYLQSAWAVVRTAYASIKAEKELPPEIDSDAEMAAFLTLDAWFEGKGQYDEAIAYLERISAEGMGIPQEVLR